MIALDIHVFKQTRQKRLISIDNTCMLNLINIQD